jgi:hypothetical protein
LLNIPLLLFVVRIARFDPLVEGSPEGVFPRNYDQPRDDQRKDDKEDNYLQVYAVLHLLPAFRPTSKPKQMGQGMLFYQEFCKVERQTKNPITSGILPTPKTGYLPPQPFQWSLVLLFKLMTVRNLHSGGDIVKGTVVLSPRVINGVVFPIAAGD